MQTCNSTYVQHNDVSDIQIYVYRG